MFRNVIEICHLRDRAPLGDLLDGVGNALHDKIGLLIQFRVACFCKRAAGVTGAPVKGLIG